jgi:hypothetical protein
VAERRGQAPLNQDAVQRLLRAVYGDPGLVIREEAPVLRVIDGGLAEHGDAGDGDE